MCITDSFTYPAIIWFHEFQWLLRDASRKDADGLPANSSPHPSLLLQLMNNLKHLCCLEMKNRQNEGFCHSLKERQHQPAYCPFSLSMHATKPYLLLVVPVVR